MATSSWGKQSLLFLKCLSGSFCDFLLWVYCFNALKVSCKKKQTKKNSFLSNHISPTSAQGLKAIMCFVLFTRSTTTSSQAAAYTLSPDSSSAWRRTASFMSDNRRVSGPCAPGGILVGWPLLGRDSPLFLLEVLVLTVVRCSLRPLEMTL